MPAKPNQKSLFIVNFLTGISDGLLLPFAGCIIAYTHFVNEPLKLTGIGLIITVIGGIAYGLARFFGEKEEIRHNHPEVALEEVDKEISLMNAIGIDVELTNDMQTQMAQERDLWLREVEENQMGWEQYQEGRALKSGLQTAFGFLAGGIIVCLPFLFVYTDIRYLILPCFFYFVLLFLFGWIKGRVLNVKSVRPTLQLLSKGFILLLLALTIVVIISIKNDKMGFMGDESPMTDITP